MKILYATAVLLLTLLLSYCSHTKKVQIGTIPHPRADTLAQKQIQTIQKDTLAAQNDTAQTAALSIPDPARTDSFFTRLLEQYPQQFAAILKNRKEWNVQIIYTEINRDKYNQPKFTDHYFNVDPAQYFYPASTVKLPIAMLALQRLNELTPTGITKNTTMITEAGYSGQVAAYNDPLTPDGRPTIANYIRRIFLVSDNEAFNRLYEFLGQAYINNQLHHKGYRDAQVLHRLDVFLTEDENRHTNPIRFLQNNNSLLYAQPESYNTVKYDERNDFLGQAHYQNGMLINQPMNFSRKNRLSLEDLHQVLRSVIFPASVPEKQRFSIADSDYRFVYKYLSEYPSESLYPSYDSANYPDAYGKFLLYGGRKGPLPKNIRILSKEGDAYGELLDIAYITDLDKKVEFFLSAAINCNTDGIVNDDKYAYDSLGLPFMKNLGEVIYNYELRRKKSYEPDLSTFKIIYDK
jgi:beta-lactamase class A